MDLRSVRLRIVVPALAALCCSVAHADPRAKSESDPEGEPARRAPIVLHYDGGGDGLLRVEVQINGKPVAVVLDSAADRIYLPSDVAESLDLPSTGRSLETTTGSGDVRTDLRTVDRLRIGDQELRGLIAGVAPSLTYALVGQSVLACFKWSVDPEAQTVTLERIDGGEACRDRRAD
jgi:predicted aspartyl protease